MADQEKQSDPAVIQSKTGRYTVIRSLGSGYSGEVLLVEDLARHERVALKLLNPEKFDAGTLEAFKREFHLLSELHHPNICKVYDFGLDEIRNRYFFTSALIEGMDLYSYAETTSIEGIEEIFVQIADALGFIHAAGLLHSDIKGSNILITETGGRPLAKIVDFGQASPAFAPSEEIAGTIRYLSPEKITRSHTVDYRSDLYSLGIVLYRMLARDYPDQGETAQQVFRWHVSHQGVDRALLRRRGAPAYLIDVVEKLLEPVPSDRFSSAAVVIRFIELHSGREYARPQRTLVTTLFEEGPLVGREEVVRSIRRQIRRLHLGEALGEDRHPVLVLRGPAGIGKSRLLKEARYLAQLSDVPVVTVDGATEGQRIGSFHEKLALSQDPLCIVIDDLDRCCEQAKEEAIAFIDRLQEMRMRGASPRLFLVVTMTVTGETEAMPVLLRMGVDHEYLRPLTEGQIFQYVQSLLGEANPPPDQIRDIFRFSGGVPELVRIAVAGLESPTARFQRETTTLFAEIIDGLAPAARELLGTLSLAARPLANRELAALSSATDEALVALRRAGLVIVDPATETAQLSAGAIGAAMEELLSDGEKKAMASKLLHHTRSHAPDDLESIVRFAEICSSKEELVEVLLSAAEALEKKNDFAAAYRHRARAIEAMDRTDTRRPNLHRQIARHLILSGRSDEAQSHIRLAASGGGLTAADLTSLSQIERLRHHPEKALTFIEDALSLPEIAPGTPEQLRLENERAQCYFQMGDLAKATELFRSTQERAQHLPDAQRRRIPNNNLGIALAEQGRFDEAIAFYREKEALFARDPRLAASVQSQLGSVLQRAGRLDESLEAFTDSWRLSSAIGDLHSASAVLGNIISLCRSKALYANAIDYAKMSARLASQAASEADLASTFLILGWLHIDLALNDIAERYLLEAERIFERQGNAGHLAWAQLARAYRCWNLERTDEALRRFHEVIAQGEALEEVELVRHGCAGAADLCLESGEVDQATDLIGRIDIPWPGPEKAREDDIRAELVRCKLRAARATSPDPDLVGRLEMLIESAARQGLRELAVEGHYALGLSHQNLEDDTASVEHFSQAKRIIDEIADGLSEEYRDAFLSQYLRKQVEESIDLDEGEASLSAGASDLPRETDEFSSRTGVSDKTFVKKVGK